LKVATVLPCFFNATCETFQTPIAKRVSLATDLPAPLTVFMGKL